MGVLVLESVMLKQEMRGAGFLTRSLTVWLCLSHSDPLPLSFFICEVGSLLSHVMIKVRQPCSMQHDDVQLRGTRGLFTAI